VAIIAISKNSIKDFAGSVFGATCPGCLKVAPSVCKSCFEQILQIKSSVMSPKFHETASDKAFKNVTNDIEPEISQHEIVSYRSWRSTRGANNSRNGNFESKS
jgi:hypothetical protein